MWDDPASWPAAGKLFLHGFEYEQFDDEAPTDPEERIGWLRLQPPELFSTMPYEQAAAVLQQSGRTFAAEEILIAKEWDRLKWGDLPVWEEVKLTLSGLLIGFGYRPEQTLFLVGVFILIGWGLFRKGYHQERITPCQEDFYRPSNQSSPSRYYPTFSALIYSLDAFIPLVDLRQVHYWLPNPTRGLGGRWLRRYLWLHIVAGWGLTTLLVVGLTGIIQGTD